MTGNGMAVAGFTLAVCALLLFWLPTIALIFWIPGLAFSIIGKRRAVRKGLSHLWLARAGTIVSILPVAVVVALLFWRR